MGLRPDRFWANVARVLGGTALAQTIPLLASVVIARLVAPAEFGIFATWLGVTQLAAVVITGRYEVALALEPDGAQRRTAMLATLGVALAASAVIALGVMCWMALSGPGKVGVVLVWLFAPTALAVAGSQAWQALAAAEGRLAELSRMRILQAASVTALQLAFAWLWPTASALAAAQVVGLALALIAAAVWLPLGVRSRAEARSLRYDAIAFLQRHRRFPLFSLPADAINALTAQLPLLVIGSRFGAEAAGQLALAMRVLGAPVALLGGSVLDVFKRESAAAWRDHGHCVGVFARTFKGLTAGALLVATLLGFCAPWLFESVFGGAWRTSGTIALWLLPLFALRFVASPLSYLFYVAGKQHVDLVWQAFLLAVVAATLYRPPQFDTTLQVYSLGYCTMYLIYLALSYRYSRGGLR
ncbi:MAG: hypothetical protein LKCHEGNO_01748 [Burkholderiaceae bacterium]|nr:hypothetical protein [Burkholderiaceae bacterium]